MHFGEDPPKSTYTCGGGNETWGDSLKGWNPSQEMNVQTDTSYGKRAAPAMGPTQDTGQHERGETYLGPSEVH